ncbi:MAG TPA: FAD-dependent monooxygenase [Methyloceanibacter sp.]|nr:FAD-dependent monooxygenase [Methyloceanibacter sp.]HZP07932.1 FAD-dependent monooxygenase [Methyloceanibacter sp.]
MTQVASADTGAPYDVAIAGGGFTGRALALALASLAPKGFGIALVDAEKPHAGPPPNGAPPKQDARALALSAATKNLLSVLGVWPALEGGAQPINSIEITDSPLHAELRPHFLGFEDVLNADEPGAYLVEYGPLYRALEDAVAQSGAIDIFAPDTVADYAADAFSVTAKLASGGALTARLLVAADGRNSKLRERAGIKCVSWSYPQVGIVTTVAHTRPHHGRAVQHFLPAGPFAMLPLTGNRSSIVWTEEKERGAEIMALDEAGFIAELARRFGAKLGELKLAGPRQSFPLALQIARAFIADRLALIGDAAHVVHPLAGQGLNIGMRDVAALAEVIVEDTRLGLDVGSPVGLERYQRWRRFDSAFSAAVMDGLNRLFSNDAAPLRVLRDLGLGLVDRAPAVKRFLVREAAGITGSVPRLLMGERL